MTIKNTVTIYGAGYVGLVTAVCLAELGSAVLVIDTDIAKIKGLMQGICPFYEPDLEQYLQRHLASKKLQFSTDITEGVAHGFFQFIAVGTPSSQDGSADLQYVLAVTDAIGAHLTEYRLIVNKSTSPVGTVQIIQQRIQKILAQREVNIAFDVVSNPEFLAQGAAIADFMRPDRIIIGTDNERASQWMTQLYAPLLHDHNRVIVMDAQSAELTKYAANAHLAMRISFMNEMSQLAEHFNADIDLVRQGIGSDRRIGTHFLFAGCGFGGSCFPKDVSALNWMAKQVNYDSPVLNAIETVNKRQKRLLFQKISHYFNHDLKGKVIALWGLSFKPNTDDMREAPSRDLINELLENQAIVQAYDPIANQAAQQIYQARPEFKTFATSQDTLNNADVLVIVTEWAEFRHPDFKLISEKLRYPAVFDGRNLYAPDSLAAYGLKYFAIGRGDNLYG